jgi:hypothetical protein
MRYNNNVYACIVTTGVVHSYLPVKPVVAVAVHQAVKQEPAQL